MQHIIAFESYSDVAEWKSLGLGSDRRDYEFNIDGVVYRVHFSGREGVVNLSFLVSGGGEEWDYRNLKSSNPYKTMNTIAKIVKDFIENNPKVNKIKFFGRDDIKNMPEWMFSIITSHPTIYYLANYMDILLNRPKQWFNKPSKRTKMFNRWIDREVKNISWKVKRIGNEIQLIRSS